MNSEEHRRLLDEITAGLLQLVEGVRLEVIQHYRNDPQDTAGAAAKTIATALKAAFELGTEYGRGNLRPSPRQ